MFRDTGPRIVMRDRSDASLEAALRVAAQKYAGRIEITGSDLFRERAARIATRLGIAVENAELQTIVSEERRRIAEVIMGTHTRQRWPERRRPPQSRSRSVER